MKLFHVFLVFFLVVGCSNDLPSRYEFLLESSYSLEEESAIRSGLPYERIELEYFSTWTWGGDRFTLDASGAVQIIDRNGTHTGKISLFDFGHICYLMDSGGFEDLNERYSRAIFDSGTATIRAWPRGENQPIEVESYANAAPISFSTIELSIHGVVHKAHINKDAQLPDTDGRPATGRR